jgi:hypothetical protein
LPINGDLGMSQLDILDVQEHWRSEMGRKVGAPKRPL